MLKYGHTFGHAIEAVTGYRTFLHGEAVSIGMNCAADLSIELGMCDPILKEKQKTLMSTCKFTYSATLFANRTTHCKNEKR